jgi:hypothetical protein
VYAFCATHEPNKSPPRPALPPLHTHPVEMAFVLAAMPAVTAAFGQKSTKTAPGGRGKTAVKKSAAGVRPGGRGKGGGRGGGAPGQRSGNVGRGLRSFTSQLNLSALNGIEGARRGCVARVKGVLGGA